ncbi:Protein MAM3 [Yarrowia sp. C11]|nr:Protein MAM3 [Yarrowia sp. C11]KAG5371098.1 Protein MAM3 [Yarrowia sp. E02]
MRTASLTTAKLLLTLIARLPLLHALPYGGLSRSGSYSPYEHDDDTLDPESSDFWLYMLVSFVLVVAGGVFAGLTIALMGQDEVYLHVISESGESHERKAAAKVLRLLKRGKHWVLVTLLLANVITNETLPIVLDRCLGGGWRAVVIATVAIVIFGEVIPQSISVRYGLSVGAYFAPFVLGLMYLLYPLAYPTALLLDHLLGEDHGTVYKKAGLKTLVTLHQTMGVERLNEDEVTIISAVLDLKEKPVGTIMTPLDDVYTMSSDTVLDEKVVDQILQAGFSRIPIHAPGEPTNFIGMLLVRILISYDPEDALPVSSFPLATLPETRPDTSCLNILNYFQEGKSHMVIVSESPGDAYGALGVLTLEDVIEELIGEEIIDESDVYIDVHRAIRRTNPGPLSKRNLVSYVQNSPRNSIGNYESVSHFLSRSLSRDEVNKHQQQSHSNLGPHGSSQLAANPSITVSTSPKTGLKLGNNAAPANDSAAPGPFQKKHHRIEPLNLAANPKETSNTKVTIKKSGSGHRATGSSDLVHHPEHHEGGTTTQYGTIFETEQEAVVDALNDPEINTRLSPRTGMSPQTGGINGMNGSRPSAIPSRPELGTEIHSFRSGGIIESVVNVQGVHKTIIEAAVSDNDFDEEDSPRSSNGSSRRGSRRALLDSSP